MDRMWLACPTLWQLAAQALHPQAITMGMCQEDGFENVRGVICGTVINNNNFIVRIALLQEGLDTAPDVALLITGGHNNRDKRIACGLFIYFWLRNWLLD